MAILFGLIKKGCNRMTFMSNTCQHPYCREPDCVHCYFFNPKAFGIPVPRRLGNFLFWLQYKINFHKGRKDF